MNRFLRLGLLVGFCLLAGTVHAEFRSFSILGGPAVLGNLSKLDSTWGAYGPTLDLVFPLTNANLAPTVGVRVDPLLILNSVQAEVGLIFNQNERTSVLTSVGGGFMVGILDAVVLYPVLDASILLRNTPPDGGLELEWGLRTNFTLYPFQTGTILTLPIGIVF